MVKVIRIILNTIVTVAVLLLALVFLLPRAFGYQPYMVVSASMQQSFPVGSLIFVTETMPEKVEVGDPITFESGTLTITHRVIAIDRANRVFTTKGDSNISSERISFDQLKGKALNFSVPYLGYFASWFITPQGRIITLILILCMVMLSVTIGKLAEIDTDENGADQTGADSLTKEGEE